MPYTSKILIVDDEETILIALSAILEDEGHSVVTCRNGASALERICTADLDLVISDLKLPDISGLEILSAIKVAKSDAPFILMTGYASVETAIEALNQGAFAYHVKPLGVNSLHGSIRNALRQRHLSKENRRLVQSLQRSNRELLQARDAALQASRVKSEFMANMSHELRTPLNAIIGYSEMLEELAQEEDQRSFIPDLKRILSSGRQLVDLIDGIMDISKIEAANIELRLETFSISGMVKDVVSVVQTLLEKNANTLEVLCEGDVGMMRADLTKVRLTLFNLLSNACKFTEGGTISLDVNRGRREGDDWVSFRVTDTGIGMGPEHIGKLFVSSSQAGSSTARNHRGSGPGLASSRSFCRMVGGDIAVESEPGKGSIFTVTLPVEVVESKTAEEREKHAV